MGDYTTRIFVLCYLVQIIVNLLLVLIALIKDLDPLYFNNKLKNRILKDGPCKIKNGYSSNQYIFIIVSVLLILLIYPYIFIMACITVFFDIPLLIKKGFRCIKG